jgi:hypothetical protein
MVTASKQKSDKANSLSTMIAAKIKGASNDGTVKSLDYESEEAASKPDAEVSDEGSEEEVIDSAPALIADLEGSTANPAPESKKRIRRLGTRTGLKGKSWMNPKEGRLMTIEEDKVEETQIAGHEEPVDLPESIPIHVALKKNILEVHKNVSAKNAVFAADEGLRS